MNDLMTLNDYQNLSQETALESSKNHAYVALGLNGEAGEYADMVKKALRGDYALDDNEPRTERLFELGDILWYVAAACRIEGVTLATVAHMNIEKLQHRYLQSGRKEAMESVS